MANVGNLIGLRGAGCGVAGTTVLSGAVAAQLPMISDLVEADGGLTRSLGLARVTGRVPQVIVSCHGLTAALAAILGTIQNHILVLHGIAGSGNIKSTCKYACPTAVGRIAFPRREGKKTVAPVPITYDLYAGDGVDSVATARVDTADSGNPPADAGFAPLSALTSVASNRLTFASALSAYVQARVFKKVSPQRTTPSTGVGIPLGVWHVGAYIEVGVEVADATEHQLATESAPDVDVVTLSFGDATGARTLACAGARLVDQQEAQYPARESGETAPGMWLTWKLEGALSGLLTLT